MQTTQSKKDLKSTVHDYWNAASCGTEITQKQKFSYDYFQEIEAYRYQVEPDIFSFAQFTRFNGKKVLEVGIGAGTDFIQWVRAGAHAHGIDLTQESIENTRHRLELYNLKAADLQVADAENLPYADATFDLVYSYGVIHHSPDTVKCLQEIIRVTKPDGSIKVMIYNRHSLFAFYRYLLCGLFKGKPFTSFSTILFNYQESMGTKAFTFKEVKKILQAFPVNIVHLKATVSKHDLLFYKAKPFQWLAYGAACLFGWNRVGWFMTIELKKFEL